MRNVLIGLFLLFAIGIISSACNDGKKVERDTQLVPIEEKGAHDHKNEVHDYGYEVAMSAYQCPMKCEGDKTYDKEGLCPSCKMDLKEIEETSKMETASEKSKE